MSLHIAHFSDLHYADETLGEVDRCFSAAVDQAIARRADVAIITGDTTDHALHAHSPALAALARQLQRLANHCPVLMLQGTFSHEPPGFLSLFPLMRGKYPICVADRLQQVALTKTGHWIASEGWQFDSLSDDMLLLCTCVPTLNRAALAACVGAAEATWATGVHLASVLAGYASSHTIARQAGVPVALLSHGTVHGCVTEHGVPMAGADHELNISSLFGAQATAVMLGHIHKHQRWESEGRTIAYAGSIGRLHYGEEGDKGFLLWNLAANHAFTNLIPTPARRTLDIGFEGPPDMIELRKFVDEHDLAGTWVRVRWQVLEEDRSQVDRARIEQLLGGAAGVKLEGRILPITRARAAGISRERTLSRQIERWAEMTGIDSRETMSCLELLEQRCPEDIAAGILHRAALESRHDEVLQAPNVLPDQQMA